MSESRPRRTSPRRAANNSAGGSLAPSPSRDSNNDTTTNNNKTKLRIRIKRWHGVAKWTWGVGDDEDDVCIVCQSAFEGVAPGVKFPGDECPVVVSTIVPNYFAGGPEFWVLAHANSIILILNHSYSSQIYNSGESVATRFIYSVYRHGFKVKTIAHQIALLLLACLPAVFGWNFRGLCSTPTCPTCRQEWEYGAERAVENTTEN
ncbi:hypothetical protein ACHAXR_009942 [Thalassiosira sp. AJA248-18]